MITVRRSSRISTSATRCSPRLSANSCHYGSFYRNLKIHKKQNRPLKNKRMRVTKNSKKLTCHHLQPNEKREISTRSVQDYPFYEVVLKALRSRPIILKVKFDKCNTNICHQLPILKCKQSVLQLVCSDSKEVPISAGHGQHQSSYSTPKRTRTNMISPPPIRRSNRKIVIDRDEYIARKFLDFEPSQTTTTSRNPSMKRVSFNLPPSI